MSRVIGDTISEFWSYLVEAVGAAWPWALGLLGLTALAVLFRGRIGAKWLFPLALVGGAAWAIHRWFGYYF